MAVRGEARSDVLSDIVSAKAAVKLRQFKRDAAAALPGRVDRVVLFGSRARGDSTRWSDYDVAVLVRELVDRDTVNDRITDAAYPHILAGIHIRPVVLDAAALDHPAPGSLAAMVVRDGIVVP